MKKQVKVRTVIGMLSDFSCEFLTMYRFFCHCYFY